MGRSRVSTLLDIRQLSRAQVTSSSQVHLVLDKLDDDCLLLVLAFFEPGSRDVIHFSHLSKRYRQITLNTPHLWSTIRWVDYEGSSHPAQWCFDLLLVRAGPTIDLSIELEATSTSARAHVNRRRIYNRFDHHAVFERVCALKLVTRQDSWSPWLDTIVHTTMPKLRRLDVIAVEADTELRPLARINVPALTRVSVRGAAARLLVPANPLSAVNANGLWPNVRFAELSYDLNMDHDWISDITHLLPSLEELKVWDRRNTRFDFPRVVSDHLGGGLRRLVMVPTDGSSYFSVLHTTLRFRISQTEDVRTGFVHGLNVDDFEAILGLISDSGSRYTATFEVARVLIKGSAMRFPGYSKFSDERKAFLVHAREAQELGIHVCVSFHDSRQPHAWHRGARTPTFDVAVLLVDAAFTSANQGVSEVEVELDGHDAWKLFVSVLRPKGGGAMRLSKITKLTLHVQGPTGETKFFPLPKSRGDRSQLVVPALREVVLKAPVGRAVFIPLEDIDELMTRLTGTAQPPRLNLIGVLISENLKP